MPRVGSIELDPVPDASGVIAPYTAAFAGMTSAEWDVYPELVAGGDWRAPCRSFLVRSGGATILVDTGVGPPGSWPDWTPEVEGRLPDELAALGVSVADVDVVFLTHLHIDHLGWNTDPEGSPFFPRARYVVHRDALDYARQFADRPHIRRCVEPLVDRFELVADDVELIEGVLALEAPGHYPGHMALRLESEGSHALLLADVAVHPALFDRLDLTYIFDVDRATAAKTRRALAPELVDRDVLVACGHYPGTGIGRLVTKSGRVTWVAHADASSTST